MNCKVLKSAGPLCRTSGISRVETGQSGIGVFGNGMTGVDEFAAGRGPGYLNVNRRIIKRRPVISR